MLPHCVRGLFGFGGLPGAGAEALGRAGAAVPQSAGGGVRRPVLHRGPVHPGRGGVQGGGLPGGADSPAGRLRRLLPGQALPGHLLPVPGGAGAGPGGWPP